MASIVIPSGLLLGTLLLIPSLFGDFTAYQIGLFLIYGIVAQGIGFLWGKTGILPLGQTIFFGSTAYASAHILINIETLGWQLVLMLLSVLIAGAIAYVLATMVFRGKTDSGPYFSLITLALVLIAEQLASTSPNITGGFNGLSGYEPIAQLDPFGNLYYLIVGVTVVSTMLLLALNRLPAGLIARAVSDNEPRLQLLGFATHKIKGLVFAMSAMLAATAGVLFASHQGIVTPTSAGFALSAQFIIWTAVGGRFHVLGPLLGSVVLAWLTAELRDDFIYWEISIAAIFILVVLKSPGGLAEIISIYFKKLVKAQVSEEPSYCAAPNVKSQQPAATLQFDQCHLQVGVVQILKGVTFTTPAQGVVCIIGPNGAGKTSLLNVITGNLLASKGTILLAEKHIHCRPPYAALSSGIGRKLQVPSVFFSMTVGENLTVATLAQRAKWYHYFSAKPLLWRSAYISSLLAHEALPLTHNLAKQVSELPQGHRQFLEFAMTAAAQPRLLLLDEPCAGLSAAETHLMTDLIRQYQTKTKGLVLLIEHDMSIVEALSDKVLVLHQGQVLAFASYVEVKANKDVAAVYAGGTK